RPDRTTQRRREAEQRQKLASLRKPLQTQLDKVEREMDELRRRLHALDALIADPDLYSDARRVERQQVLAEHGELAKRLDVLEEEWLQVQTSLDELAASSGN